jgi:hypothetical protein
MFTIPRDTLAIVFEFLEIQRTVSILSQVSQELNDLTHTDARLWRILRIQPCKIPPLWMMQTTFRNITSLTINTAKHFETTMSSLVAQNAPYLIKLEVCDSNVMLSEPSYYPLLESLVCTKKAATSAQVSRMLRMCPSLSEFWFTLGIVDVLIGLRVLLHQRYAHMEIHIHALTIQVKCTYPDNCCTDVTIHTSDYDHRKRSNYEEVSRQIESFDNSIVKHVLFTD